MITCLIIRSRKLFVLALLVYEEEGEEDDVDEKAPEQRCEL